MVVFRCQKKKKKKKKSELVFWGGIMLFIERGACMYSFQGVSPSCIMLTKSSRAYI